MLTHLLVLLLILVILHRKVKITIELRKGNGSVRLRAGPPPVVFYLSRYCVQFRNSSVQAL